MVADLKNNIRFEFSISPKAQYVGSKTKRVQLVYQETVHWLHKYLKPYANYVLYAEMPKPNVWVPGKVAHIHFHGWVKFKKLASFLAESYHFLTSHMTAAVNDERTEIWTQYIEKDKDIFSEYFGKYYVITDKDADTFLDMEKVSYNCSDLDNDICPIVVDGEK